MNELIGISIGTMILSIWFLTEWRVHFFNLFKWDCHSANIERMLYEKLNFGIGGFTLGSMLACPFCMGFWIALGISFFCGTFPIIYVGQIILFGVIKSLKV